ncbi:flagellin [Devosia sp. 66-22]|mgnify:CR=1 FL=1|uniref:flagellin N-terminal helical domain-containing protein n=1 Tax=Devosia sp. 66-22 TaxID=1895753 RepID=UPI000925D933|nr:flagellin [Devosia sp. 66-22]OJX50813.1 MAG: hypothetical protein BGO81_21505 [Devosia sp. 66-22]
MAEITLSKAVRSNLLNLQSTASMLSKSQERLSSGLRVNSALDNPTNFFTAQGLNSRASDLSQLADAVSNAVQTVAAADKGITAITKLVESAQATARQALQTAETTGGSGPSSVAGTVAIGADSTASVNGGVDISNPPSGIYSIAGSDSKLTLDVGGTQLTFHFYNTNLPSTPDPGTIGIDTDDGGSPKSVVDGLADMQAGLRASGVAGTADATVGLDGSGQIEITLGSDATRSLTIVSDTSGTVGDSGTGFGFVNGQTSAPNAAFSGLNGTLTVGSNTLTFGASAIDSRAELVTALAGLGGGITGSIDGSDHLTFSSGSGFTIGGTLNVSSAFGITEQAYGSIPNPKRAELVATYNDLLGQIDALAKDSGFNGVNLLNGDDLSVIFNEDGSSKIDIKGVDNTTGVSGLNLASLASTEFNTNAGVNGVLDDLKGVIDKLRGQSAKFGSNLSVVETRQDFTKQMISVLQTGASNLTLADTNEEAANVLALQTRQQLSSTALSLASQADQNVLRLF